MSFMHHAVALCSIMLVQYLHIELRVNVMLYMLLYLLLHITIAV